MVYHFIGYYFQIHILIDKIKNHIGIKHFCVFMPWKEVVIIPDLHYFNKFLRFFFYKVILFVVRKHFKDFFFRKAHHFIKCRQTGYVISYIKSACYIIHSNRWYSCDEKFRYWSAGAGGSGFYNIKEVSVKTFSMGYGTIFFLTCRRYNRICKVIIFVY